MVDLLSVVLVMVVRRREGRRVVSDVRNRGSSVVLVFDDEVKVEEWRSLVHYNKVEMGARKIWREFRENLKIGNWNILKLIF